MAQLEHTFRTHASRSMDCRDKPGNDKPHQPVIAGLVPAIHGAASLVSSESGAE
jgi:hypothetical protein